MTSATKTQPANNIGPDGNPCPFSKEEQQALARELGERKLQNALRLIQEAQNRIGQACEELSPIIGGVHLGRRGNKLYVEIKTFWHVVSDGRERLRGKGSARVDDVNLIAEMKRRSLRREQTAALDGPGLAEIEAAEEEGRQLAAEGARSP